MKHILQTILLTIIFAIFTTTIFAADGDFDLTFNGTGKNRFGLGLGNEQFNGVAVQTDGKIVAVGGAMDGESFLNRTLLRFNADGSPDSSFGVNGVVVQPEREFITFYAVAIQPDGKIVAVGEASSLLTSLDFVVARYNTDGTLDTTFDSDGFAITNFFASTNLPDVARAVSIQSDGKIVVGGTASNTSNESGNRFAVARFNADGSLDTTFDGDGKVTTLVFTRDQIHSLAIQPDGKIVAAGFTGLTDVQFALVRYNSDGSLDTSFDGDGRIITSFGLEGDRAYSVLIQTDGKIVAAGSATISFSLDFAVARYNADGTLDTSFDSDGLITTPIFINTDEARSILLQPDGKLVASGTAIGGDSISRFTIVRYNSNGSLDTSFDSDGKVTTAIGSGRSEIFAAAQQTDGKLIAVGLTTSPTFDSDSAIVRYNANGSLDTSFDSDGIVTKQLGNTTISVGRAVALQPDGKIVVAGRFFTFNWYVARFNADGTLDNTFDGDGRVITTVGFEDGEANAVLIQSDSKIVVFGTSDVGGFGRITVVRYNPNGSLDTSFDGDGRVTTSILDDRALTGAIQADGKILAAGTNGIGFAIVRYNPDGSLDTSFDGDGIVTTSIGSFFANILDLKVLSDGKILAGGVSFNGLNNDFTVARYNANGSLDTTFGINGIVTTPIFSDRDDLRSIAVQPDGKYVATGTTFTSGFDRFATVRYNPDGTLDTTFDGDGIVTTVIGIQSGVASKVFVQPNGKILVSGWGVFSASPNFSSDFVVVRYNSDGSLDNSLYSGIAGELFGSGGIARVDISSVDFDPSMAVQPDGRIVLVGRSNGLIAVSRLQNSFAPTAANASISGRVLTQSGRGIQNTFLTITDSTTGERRQTRSSTFGYYNFQNLQVGRSYVLSVNSKRFVFAEPSRVITLLDDLTDADFIADEKY